MLLFKALGIANELYDDGSTRAKEEERLKILKEGQAIPLKDCLRRAGYPWSKCIVTNY